MSNELAIYQKIQNPIDAIDKLGVMFAKSGIFGCDNENAGKILAMICLSENKSPTEIVRRFDVISGKLRVKAQAAYADFRAKGGRVKWLATGDDGQKAEAEFSFENQTFKLAFTIEQAQKMGLVKPNSGWTKTPGNMLRARVLSNGIGMLCPEIFAGDDGEQPEAPAPTIALSTTVEPVAATNAATSRTPAQPPVVEAEVIKESPQTPAPTPPPAVHSAPALSPVATPPESKPAAVSAELPEELVVQLEQAIGEHAVAAHKWMLKEGWLTHGQSMANLSPTRAQRVIKQSASFIRAVTGSAS